MSSELTPDQYEDRELLERCQTRDVAYVARPEGMKAAERLRLAGKVTYTHGEGRDQGLLLVRLVGRRQRLGGDAA